MRTRAPSTASRFRCSCAPRLAFVGLICRQFCAHSLLTVIWPWFGSLDACVWICFFAFWLLNMVVVWRGIETIRLLEGISAPFMLGVGLLLLWWITTKAGGLGPVLSAKGKFQSAPEFFRFFVPSLTAMVGFWATV